jgi:hypothetical protein
VTFRLTVLFDVRLIAKRYDSAHRLSLRANGEWGQRFPYTRSARPPAFVSELARMGFSGSEKARSVAIHE